MSQEFIVEQTPQGAIVAHVTSSGTIYDAFNSHGFYMGFAGTLEGARNLMTADWFPANPKDRVVQIQERSEGKSRL